MRRAWLVFSFLSLISSSLAEERWFPFSPANDPFSSNCPIDLRFLNEKVAGEHGYITVKDGQFTRSGDGQPVRFWAVNGPPHSLRGQDLKDCARMLAKRGVNMVRVHGGFFDSKGEVDEGKVRHAVEVVEAMKAEGIYVHFSIYFPLWIQPAQGTPWLEGYDGKQHPFAALFFNKGFQTQYRKWWTALLNARVESTGKTLAEEPTVAGLEIQNEDSFFFWTFAEKSLPEPQLAMLEKQFGQWAGKKYGSPEAALSKWNVAALKRDAPAEGRLAFRPLYAMFTEKTLRDQDTAQFLYEVQSSFYSDTYALLRKLGFKGPITASNWSTASPEVFGPLEKLSYTTCDFVDRHGYFSCNHSGENAAWSIRVGHTYSDRSAYRFDPEQPGKPKVFNHPLMDVHYNNKPSMLSETTWTRPNRYRSEAPIYAAAYGALQHSDAIVHFALDGAKWSVKPGFWVQPWTLMSPAMMGQFPAAALIFRQGLVQEGKVVANINLNTNDLLKLKGTPLPQEASLDELRQQDLPKNTGPETGARITPLLHYVGRTSVTFSDQPKSVEVTDADKLIDAKGRKIRSSTGQLLLDYNLGTLLINAPKAQGISGNLAGATNTATANLIFNSDMTLGHIICVSLDGSEIANSRKMLLQVMSEEKPQGFTTEDAGSGKLKITNLGADPWTVREFSGSVVFKTSGSGRLKVTALDANGYPVRAVALDGNTLRLEPQTCYYLVER